MFDCVLNALFYYNTIDYNWTRKKTNEKYFTKRYNQKRDKKIQQKHISHCSLKQNCEKVGRGLEAGGKKMNIYLKLKKENNVRTMVLEICS